MTELILALDCPDRLTAASLVENTREVVQTYKVGPELLLAIGPDGIKELRLPRLMLDLKFKDIPRTVANAVRASLPLLPRFITIHQDGGPAMIAAARRAAEQALLPPMIIAVLRLTSLEPEGSYFLMRLAKSAISAGANGLVCSPAEVEDLRKDLGSDVIFITPGVRPLGGLSDDHAAARVATPAAAARAGADFVVVGRPISQAEDPRAAAKAIVRELQSQNTSAPRPQAEVEVHHDYSDEELARAEMWEMP